MPTPVVGLIGCGHIGQFHSRNIRGSLRSELVPGEYVAVCDRDASRAESFAAITNARVVTDQPSDVFETSGLSAVYICTETAEHPALVVEAAHRGLHIFCEKPLAKTLADVRAMVDAVEAAGVVNQVGLVLRYSPVFTVMKELMSDPGLGTLLTAHLRDDQFFPIRGQYGSSWRGDFERAGGGTLIEHSIHDVDLFRWLFGDISAVRCHTRYTTDKAGIEDVALVTFQHEGGHQTTLSSIWHDCDDRPSTRRLEVFYTGGYFATDSDFIGPITVQGRTGAEREIGVEEVWERYQAITGLSEDEMGLARRGMYEDYAFLRCVHEERPAFPDFRTALAAHVVVDACYRSAQGACEVLIEKP
ncbi:MAG TPA: Gfo/Idh/MocA family oxidoreductase [Candidatus Saccharimonadales bacterium]|nr:Gfo/Idh/MocA family oxidoreductase [Candidatus Saccharimonadales bacterium]